MLRLGPWSQVHPQIIDSVSATAALPGTENLTAPSVESLESTPISSPSDIMWSDYNSSDGELDITPNSESPSAGPDSVQQTIVLPQSNINPCIAPEQPLSSTSSPTEGVSGDLGSLSYVTETSRTSSPPSTLLPSVERLRELMQSWEAGSKSPVGQPIQEDSPILLEQNELEQDTTEQPLSSVTTTSIPPLSVPSIPQQTALLSGSLLSLFFPDRSSPPPVPQIQSNTSTPSPIDSQVATDPAIVSLFCPPTQAPPLSDDMDQNSVIQVSTDIGGTSESTAVHELLDTHANSFSTSIAETPTLLAQQSTSYPSLNYSYSMPSSRASSVPPFLPDSYPYVAIPQSPVMQLFAYAQVNSAQPILEPSSPVEGGPFGCRSHSPTVDSEDSYFPQPAFRSMPPLPVYPRSMPSFPLTTEDEDNDSEVTRTDNPGQEARYRPPTLQESYTPSIANTVDSATNSNRSDDESFGNIARGSNASSWYAYVRSERLNRDRFADRDRTVTPTLPYGINRRTASHEVRDSRPLPPLPTASENLTSPWFYGPLINDCSSGQQHLDVPSTWISQSLSPVMPICVLPPSAPPTTSPTPPPLGYNLSPPLPSPPLSFDHAFTSLSLKDTAAATAAPVPPSPAVRIPINDNSTPSGRPPSSVAPSWGMPAYSYAGSAPPVGVTPRLSSCYTGSTLPRDARLTAPPPPRSYTGMSPSYWGMSPNYGGNMQNDPSRDIYTTGGGYKPSPWSYPSQPPASYRKLRFAPLPDTPVYKNGGYAPSYAANNNVNGYTPRRNSMNHLSPVPPMPSARPLASPRASPVNDTLNVPPRFPSPQIPTIIPPSFSGPAVYNYGVSNASTNPIFPPPPSRPDFDFYLGKPPSGPWSWTPPVQRSKFYFEDGNLSFEVGGKSFMIHRHFLQQHSEKLRSQYGPILPSSISLDDEITLDEVEKLLTIFYPTDLTAPDLTSVSDWEHVLSISVELRMPQIKTLALQNLTRLATHYERMAVFKRISDTNWNCARDPEVMQWRKDALKELCLQQEPPSLEDAKKVDLEMLVGIWQARHELSGAGLSTGGGAATNTVSAPVDISTLGGQGHTIGGPRPRRTEDRGTPAGLPKMTDSSPYWPSEAMSGFPIGSTANRRVTGTARKTNLNDLLVDRLVEEKFGLNVVPLVESR
ncbi:hypothetical protein CVT24_004271 [Panaeolus cyanescens]|uniref:BTB domain-containing protein n=1 Tax=Panaeolus cyanescens TaxID=181874 RepID=A0A409VA93_9AGAR|nr:hypothetical protein CVT24_004271 [Panaeolus cyanescens]